MAFEVKKIDPLDLQPRKAIGVTLPFSGTAVFNSSYQSKEAVKTNLINFFLTSQGERFMNPTFGNRLQTLLFEQLTEDKVAAIDSSVRRDLGIYFPKVVVRQVGIDASPDTNTVTFYLVYSIKDTNIDDEVIINFEQ